MSNRCPECVYKEACGTFNKPLRLRIFYDR